MTPRSVLGAKDRGVPLPESVALALAAHLEAAEVPARREDGMHALRRHYASVLLEGGVNTRALADFLGHNDPALPSGCTPT